MKYQLTISTISLVFLLASCGQKENAFVNPINSQNNDFTAKSQINSFDSWTVLKIESATLVARKSDNVTNSYLLDVFKQFPELTAILKETNSGVYFGYSAFVPDKIEGMKAVSSTTESNVDSKNIVLLPQPTDGNIFTNSTVRTSGQSLPKNLLNNGSNVILQNPKPNSNNDLVQLLLTWFS